jgi:hypothetical protein
MVKSRGVVTKGCGGESQGATGAAARESHLRGKKAALQFSIARNPLPQVATRHFFSLFGGV